ncbi:MAG TPA: DoxX family protein [Pyrinomonadaceae bacterium]|jgi:putative oxidoreductase|nr:DoxX family protein [Pyrinomonadaceae bacterium]
MADLNAVYSSWSPRLLSILRIVTGFLIMQHGSPKLFGVPAGAQPAPTQTAFSLLWFAGVLEVFGGLLILLGLFTRPVAFILAGEMAVAYFMAHATNGFWPLLNRGELAALYCFVFLYLSAAGGGPWSIDNLWRRNETARDSVTV